MNSTNSSILPKSLYLFTFSLYIASCANPIIDNLQISTDEATSKSNNNSLNNREHSVLATPTNNSKNDQNGEVEGEFNKVGYSHEEAAIAATTII